MSNPVEALYAMHSLRIEDTFNDFEGSTDELRARVIMQLLELVGELVAAESASRLRTANLG